MNTSIAQLKEKLVAARKTPSAPAPSSPEANEISQTKLAARTSELAASLNRIRTEPNYAYSID